jgi:hypothetical protein
VTFPQRYHHTVRRERFTTALVSRFLDPPEVAERFDVRGPSIDVREDAATPTTGAATVDALLADLFG